MPTVIETIGGVGNPQNGVVFGGLTGPAVAGAPAPQMEWFHYFNGDTSPAVASINQVPGGVQAGSPFGIPIINANYDSFLSGSYGVDTGLIPNTGMGTLIALLRSPSWNGTTVTNTDIGGNENSSEIHERFMFNVQQDGLHAFMAGDTNSLTMPVVSAPASGSPGCPGAWFMVMLQYSAGGQARMDNLTAGTFSTGNCPAMANPTAFSARIGTIRQANSAPTDGDFFCAGYSRYLHTASDLILIQAAIRFRALSVLGAAV